MASSHNRMPSSIGPDLEGDERLVRVVDLLAHEADASRRLVIVLVGRFDLRVTVPLEHAWRIPARDRRALHVAEGDEGLWELGQQWMEHVASFPLYMVENDGGVAESVARVVERELSAFDEIVVLGGRINLGRRFHRLLHDRTADAIARLLTGMPGVVVALTTVAST